jgi:hypothetical protein
MPATASQPPVPISNASTLGGDEPGEAVAPSNPHLRDHGDSTGMPVSGDQPPAYSNPVPPPVLIDGCPSLRLCFRGTCLYRQRRVPTLEWRSHYFFRHITNAALRTEHENSLGRDGFIGIPDALFGPLSPDDERALMNFLPEFFERYALPRQSLATFAVFTDATTGVLEAKRISWWKTLADHFSIPHYLDRIYNMTPGDWHVVMHSLPTFSAIREFAEVTEALGFRRAREMIHQQLARDVAFIKGNKKINAKTHFRLLKMGYEELRELSKQHDQVAEDIFPGQGSMEWCAMCDLYPAMGGVA